MTEKQILERLERLERLVVLIHGTLDVEKAESKRKAIEESAKQMRMILEEHREAREESNKELAKILKTLSL